MAKSSNTEIQKASLPMDDPQRFKLSEIGSSGLDIFNGVSNQELKQELNHPNSIKTFKLMSYHPACNAALGLYSAMISKIKYRIIAPKDATQEEKDKAKIIEQMLFQDMEYPFESFIQDALTMTTYGFSVVEKVYRKRNKAAGSLFNDGLIAPKRLALRHQQSIEKFVFSEDGSELKGVKQLITNTNDPLGRYKSKGNAIVIPRSKFMLFTSGNSSSNPFGVSPLRNVYLPWKYLSALEELECVGINKDLSGVPLARVPASYMSSDATPEQKAIYESFKNIVRNMQAGNQSGLILPSAVDPETRQKLFDIELLSVDGKRGFDIDKVKQYYRSMIFIGLQADVLLMGNTSTGSFALGSIKNSLTGNVVESFIKNIIQVINLDLIKQIYELNGWDASRACKVDYDDVQEVDLDVFSSAIQRITAVGLTPKTLDVVNKVLDSLGVDPLPETTTQEELDAMLSDMTTRSGDGMQSGMSSGTGDAVSSTDNSLSNLANAP